MAEDDGSTQTIPLLKEEVSVGKQVVERSRIRVVKQVRERDEHVDLDLRRDAVEIERVPVNREVAEQPAVRRDGDTTIIPVVEEVIVVEKRLVLREEIHVHQRSVTERVQEVVRLRSEHAEITRDPAEQPSTELEKGTSDVG